MERPRIVIDVSSSDEDTIYPRPSRAGPAISQSVKKGIKPRKSHNRRQKEGSPQPTRRRQGQKSSETEEEVKIEVKPKKKPDRFKLARELFGYLTLLDPRYKPFLKKSGFANSIQADQNSAFILRRGCIGYVTTCKLKVMDVRLFRAGIYAMWDGPVYFHDFVLQSVLEADTPVFFILMIDYALMTTAFRGKWPDTGRTLTRMLLLRRALVQMQFEMRTPILTMAAVNNPEMSGSLIGEISKTITEQPVYVEDPKQIMEQEIDCEEDRSKWLQMMNAMSAYFSSMLTEEKPPHSNTLTWAEESHFEKIADANFEFSRARQAGVKFLVKKFPGYFLVCHEWPQYSWDEYLEFIQTDELKEFKETAECAVADEANMHKPLQQKIKKLESIRDGQIENGLNIADTVALLSSAKAELAASRGFSVQMDPKLAYYYGHAPGFTCPDNWIDLLMDDTYPFHDVEGLDKKLEKRLENCDANVRKLIQTIKAETEKAQREHRQMLESRYCEFAQWNSIPEQLGADRYSSAKFLHLMRTNLSKTRHETSQDMYEDAFTILFLLMIKRANAVAAVKAGLDQPEMSMLERSEMNITGVGQNETQISELPASAIAEITNPNTNPEESSEQCNTAANGNVNDERISNPTITDVPQNEEPRAISSTHTAVSTLQMTEEETEAPVAETTSEKNKHAVEKKTKKGKKSAKVTREEPVVDNNDEEEQEAQPAKKKKKTDPTISRTMTLRKR